MSITNEEIIKQLGSMNALELKQLSDAIRDHFKITEMTVAATSDASAATSKPAITEYDIKITHVDNKLSAIKCFKEKDWSKSDLKTAKDYLEDANRPTLMVFLKRSKKFSDDEVKQIIEDLKEASVDAQKIE